MSTAIREKRAFKRYLIRLPASLRIAGGGTVMAEIRDFCSGGLFVCYDGPDSGTQSKAFEPAPGHIVEIRCTVPTPAGDTPLFFQGHVVRAGANSIGVSFVEPKPGALNALHDFATKPGSGDASKAPPSGSKTIARSDAPGGMARPSSLKGTASPPARNELGGAFGLEGKAAQSMLSTCKQMGGQVTRRLADAFVDQVGHQLLSAAEALQAFRERNAYYDASNAFTQHAEAFKRNFEARMQARLNQPPSPAARPAERDRPAYGATTLSLVEPGEFEDWLAFSDIVRQAELQFQEQLGALEQRLGLLFRVPVGKQNNPFGPASFCQAFQDALTDLDLDRAVLPTIYVVFKDVLCANRENDAVMGTLYDELNQLLAKKGVLPKLPNMYRIPSASARAPDAPRHSGDVGHPTSLANVADPRAAQDGTAGRDVPSGSLHASAPPVTKDWYHLVQSLGSLRQQVSQHEGHRPRDGQHAGRTFDAFPISVGDSSAAEHRLQPEFYSPDELLSALSRLHIAPRTQIPAERVQQDVKSELLSMLAQASGDAEQKQLGERESKILGVTGTLVDSMLEDKQVAGNVARWLRQLSIPLFKIAIRDDSLFLDKSHLARQLINSVARLEFYGESENDNHQNAVRKNIEGLLTEITTTEDVTPELLGKALKHINALVRLQEKVYRENVREVSDACQEIDSVVATTARAPGESSVHQPRPGGSRVFQHAPEDDVRDLAEWRTRVRRLSVGDRLLLDIASGPRRVNLAWIARDFERYVFVNAKGLEEATLSQDELARQMRGGAAVVLDDAAEPLFDRAQNDMLQKVHRQLLHETTHDQLTGLMNRREFERCLAEALAKVRETELQQMMCYVNLDQFAVINNALGYSGGDQLLVDVATLFKEALGDRGLLARLGGDEFGMLFMEGSVDEALAIIARQRDAIQEYRLTVADKTASIAFSAGLVALNRDSNTVAALLQAAEASCRVARGKGKNHVHLYHADDVELSRHTQIAKWATRIDEALDGHQLALRLQPIVCIADHALHVQHSEVLLTVRDEHGEFISPADFVVAAEQLRRMPAVDRWVIEHAFRWMVDNPDKLAVTGGLAINLSGASMNEEGLADFILEQAQRMNVPMDHVCFEVTETAGIANLYHASELILALKAVGSTFALDDFGSGLSSYAYLKNLPVDFLKIDGVFVKDMHENPYDYAVVKSITEIGHFMGKKIIAEYVESDVILGMLRDIGVDYAQGYATGKPRPLEEF